MPPMLIRLVYVAIAGSALLAAQQSAADAFNSALGGDRAKDPATNQAQPAAPVGNGIPAGSAIVVKLVDDIDSERDPVGRTFPAMVDDPLVVNGKTLLPRGTDVMVRLVQDPKAGSTKGGPVLTLDLAEIVVGGRTYPVNADSVALTTTPRAVAQPQQAVAAKPSGASVLGGLLGALSGTDQGAEYIGSVTGSASSGLAKTWVTGVRVRLNEETRLTFKLKNAVRF